MSEPKDFVTRWSRRKRAVSREAAASPSDKAQPAEAKPSAGPPPASVPDVDLTKLPPVESIGAETDIRAFLQRGVPAALTRAALRRVWSADPAIRDFIGLSENSWDFNAPGAIYGFDPPGIPPVLPPAPQIIGQARDSVLGGPSAANSPSCTQSASVQDKSENARAGDKRKDVAENENGGSGTLQNCDKKVDVIVSTETGKTTPVQLSEERREADMTLARRRHGGALPE